MGLEQWTPDSATPSPRLHCIKGDDVLDFRFELPVIALSSLPELLALEIEGATPFRREQLIGGYRLLPGPQRDRVTCHVLLTPRQTLTATADADFLLLEAGNGAIRLPASQSADRPWHQARRRHWRRQAILAACAVFGLLAAPQIYAWRLEQALAQARPALADARSEAAAAAAMRDRLQALSAARARAAGLGATAPTAVETIAALTQTLDDDSHLESLAMEAGQWRLAGVSPSASQAIDAIAALPFAQDVAFDRAVTVLADGREAFAIRFKAANSSSRQDTANAATP
ncbi:MAG: hypothetical protein Tsb0016_10240 [Sphingomonadales bacterium]